jgi:hypothetical protein
MISISVRSIRNVSLRFRVTDRLQVPFSVPGQLMGFPTSDQAQLVLVLDILQEADDIARLGH